MKTRRNIYIVAGGLFILLNLIFDITEPGLPGEVNNSFNIGYLIGSHILAIAGFVLLRQAYKIHKKIKWKMADAELKDSIEAVGKK